MSRLKHISKGTFGYHVLTLASGTLLGQLILFASLPLLQRYFYGPEAFGFFTVYVSLSELIISIAGLKYEYGIVRVKKQADAANLLFLSFCSVIAVSFVSLLVFLAWLYFFPQYGQVKELGYYSLAIPFSVLFFGAANTFSYWFNRTKNYKQISAGKLASSVSSEPVKYAWAIVVSSKGMGLILGRIVGQFSAFLYGLYAFFKKDKKVWKLKSWKRIKQLALSQKSYPLYVLPSALITVFITALYVQFFSSHFGKEKVGLLGVAVSYLGVAFGIVSGAIGQVFYGKIAEIHNYQTLKKLYLQFTGLLSIPALAAVILVFIIPADFVSALLGERWADIMPVSRIMVPWMAIAFVSSSLSFMHIRLETQKKLLVIDSIHLIAVVLALYLGFAYFNDFYAVLICFCLAQAIHYILVIFAAFYFLHHKAKNQAE